jgi:signal peptidase
MFLPPPSLRLVTRPFPRAGRDIPIVHRVLRVHVHRDAQGDEAVDFLTKGDNNSVDDRNLYAPGQMWLKRSEVVGRAVASVPYVGMATILLNDYPTLKYVLIGLMGLLVLAGKDA